MNKKQPHIGLYLAAKPEAGGIYQYALSIIDALKTTPNIRVTCFVEDPNWQRHIPDYFHLHVNSSSKLKKGVGRIVRKVSFSLRNKQAGFFDRSVTSINKSDCDLVIFPSQDSLTYQINKPALTAVHDLMHRYESHFDEYQHGIYNERELHYQAICENARGILVDSELGKQHVIESYNVPATKVHVLKFVPPFYLKSSPAVDIKSKYNLPDEFIFYPAQFWEHKNHKNLVRAVKILKDQGIKIHTVFIGSAKNNYDCVIQLIDDLKLKDEISVLGYIPLNEIVSFYKQATAMIFVSLAGPTNIPPVEAMMLGCPAIVSDAYAMPEQVGEGALLVDAKSPEDIAKKIKLLHQDDRLRETLIEKGFEQIKKWDQDAFNQRLAEIIQLNLEKKQS
ncbi:MAG: glycosyltransferase family 1 protein [Crocinitomicaceae bacterium]